VQNQKVATMNETEFEFQKVKQILELKQGHRMSPGERVTAKAIFYFAKGVELKQKLEPKKRRKNFLSGVFQAVRDFSRKSKHKN